MESAGLVTLQGKGRGLEVQATAQGREVYLRSMAGWDQAQARLKRMLKREGVEAIALLSESLSRT
jgi:hypothetical protein